MASVSEVVHPVPCEESGDPDGLCEAQPEFFREFWVAEQVLSSSLRSCEEMALVR
jgi:hypothetical protein